MPTVTTTAITTAKSREANANPPRSESGEPVASRVYDAREALLAKTIERMEAAAIRFCHLRSSSTEETLARFREVDLLVDSRDLAELERIAYQLGFVRLATWGHGGHHFYVAFESGTGGWLKLDVVTRLRFGGRTRSFYCGALDGCVARRVRSNNAWTPCAPDAMLGLLLHCILDKGGFPEKHRRDLGRLRDLIAADSGQAIETERVFESALGRCLRWSAVSSAIAAGEWSELLDRLTPIAFELFRRAPYATARGWLSGGTARLTHLIRTRTERGGFFVALVGSGAARTRWVARALQRDTEGCFVVAQRDSMAFDMEHSREAGTRARRPDLVVFLETDGSPAAETSDDPRHRPVGHGARPRARARDVATIRVDASASETETLKQVTAVIWARFQQHRGAETNS